MVLEEGNVRKRSISKKLGMDITHQKKSKLNDKRMFSCGLESAENYSKDIILRKMIVINKTKRKNCISGSESSRSIHEVIIASTPTCICENFSKYSARVLMQTYFMFSQIRYRIFNSGQSTEI